MIWNILIRMYMGIRTVRSNLSVMPEQDDFSDPYNLVYGHNMKNGGMFADVVDFTNKEYFETHQKESSI